MNIEASLKEIGAYGISYDIVKADGDKYGGPFPV
jgi:hypothetical protein